MSRAFLRDDAEGEGIQVTFLDQTGAKSVKAKISPTVEVKKIIPNIITKMQLPVTAPDGTPRYPPPSSTSLADRSSSSSH